MKAPKPILLLTNMKADDPTAEGIFEALGRAYREAGHPVLAAGQSNPFLASRPLVERRSWGELHRLGGSSNYLSARSRRTFRALVGLLGRSRAVHFHFGCTWNPAAALLRALERRPIPCVASFHDWANPSLRAPARLQKRGLRPLLRRCRRVTAVSSQTARLLAADFPEIAGRLRVVPHGLRPERIRARNKPPESSAAPYALCAARQASYKGTDILLTAWKDAAQGGAKARLILCGPDETGGHFQRYARLLGIADQVDFAGVVSRERYWRLVDGSLFCVLASRHEAFGLSALEAMSRGKAVVATRSGGPESFVENGVSGLLVPPGDVNALRGAMERLMRDGGLRRRLGRAARAQASRFRAAAAARSYLRLLALPSRARRFTGGVS